jgi:hypothetical protein
VIFPIFVVDAAEPPTRRRTNGYFPHHYYQRRISSGSSLAEVEGRPRNWTAPFKKNDSAKRVAE